MEGCPGKFQAQTEDELHELIGTHARVAHGEDVSAWSDEEKAQIQALIKTVE
jgi:predicted small metal-binding protein